MSEHWNETESRIILERYKCEYCGALPRQWCITKSGNRASFLHAMRGYEIRSFVWMVYEEGERAGRFFTERRMQREIDQLKEAMREMRLTYA